MRYLSLAVLVVASFGIAVAHAAPNPEVSEPIRAISSSAEIDFPDELVIKFEAEADAVITQITFFYQLGRQKATIYGYPAFTPGRSVTTEFRIKTGGANFLPTGVDIEYYYVVRDAAGNTFESERFTIEYKDPAFDWQRLQDGGLVILWHDRSERDVERVLAGVAPRLEEVRSLFGLADVGMMKAVIVNSSREARRSFPFISQAATSGHVYGGFAFGELGVFVLQGLDPDGIIHETTHLLLDEAVDSPLARVPSWLNEGLSMYFESGRSFRESALAGADRDGDLLPLRGMASQPGRPRDVGLFYAKSENVVRYMMDTYGSATMGALLGAINDGRSIDAALRQAYGVGLNELDRLWSAHLAGETAAPPPVDPRTSATTLIITGAIIITASAIAFRWLKRITTPSRSSGP
ncbi:MAG: hypothetical protein IH956_04980 [Chloroflexi bacterium]|nr:hypothetical protein [Chloroflexota bacterium]